MKKIVHNPSVEQLFDAILTLKSREDCYAFFEDICTPNELLTLSQRFDVGLKLLEGQTYQVILENTGASTATISRVKRLLGDDNDGIEMAAKRLKK